MVRGQLGFALVELLVSGVLILALVQGAWWVVAVQGGASTRVAEEARSLDAARVTRQVLRAEIQASGSPEDFHMVASEIRLRAFRGMVVFCDGEGAEWWVNAVGHRRLDPGKDSVLVFDAEEGWLTGAIRRRTGSTSGRCPVVSGFSEERWTFEATLAAPVTGRYFERGAYRFSDGAFRSFQGRGGWQPVTEENLDSDLSAIESDGHRGIRVRMTWRNPENRLASTSWLSWVRW